MEVEHELWPKYAMAISYSLVYRQILIYFIMIKGCDFFRTNLPNNKGGCLWLGCLANIVKQFRAYFVIQSKTIGNENSIAMFIIFIVVGLSFTP